METGDILVLGGLFAGVVGFFVLLALVFDKLSNGSAEDRWGAAPKTTGRLPKKPKKTKSRNSSSGEPLFARMLKPLSHFMQLGDRSHSRVQETLVHAGVRDKTAVDVFLGAKFALAFALPAAVVVFMLWRSGGDQVDPGNLIIFGSMALVAGLLLPNMWLQRKAKNRITRIRLSLPDALDLLIVCVESGLGLDAALVRISKELEQVAPELCEELRLLNLEISAGKPREECLRNLALRTGCDEVESLMARINQAARYGTNLGHSLRIHSETLREKRRQEAEERAAKTTIKLLFPLVFFIFPAIFIVILGPAAAKVAEQFVK